MNRNWLFGLALCLSLGACSGDRVVLLSDPDGKVGRVEVSSAAGAQLLIQAKTEVVVSGSSAPSAPKPISDEAIQSVWGSALKAMPPVPLLFQLYFRPGTSDLTDAGKAEVPKVVAAIASRSYPVVLVAGHADAEGSEKWNLKVSGDRARAIRDVLVAKGIKASEILVSSHGKRNPLVPTPDGVAEPRNRRVTVTVQ